MSMATSPDNYSQFDASKRDWSRDGSWLGRFGARVGLQGKLVLCFMSLLTVALGASCVIFLSQTKACVDDIIREQAQQLASTLAWSSEDSLASGENRSKDLALVAANLIK